MKLDDPSIGSKKLYFINECVEDKLRKYLWTNCTNAALRDSIMDHANELIIQIIRKHNLHVIYPGHDDSAFGDLAQTGWVQVERTLYKFRAKPHCRKCYNPDRPNQSTLYQPANLEYGIITFEELFGEEVNPDRRGQFLVNGRKCGHCGAELCAEPEVEPRQGLFGGSESVLFRGDSKVFNMWSQVSRTVILAVVKREGRDKKNSGSYRSHLSNKARVDEDKFEKFFLEAADIFKYSKDQMRCLEALKEIVAKDERPHDGLIGKLAAKSGLSRAQVGTFIKMIRLRSRDFTDSPFNKDPNKVMRAAMAAADDSDHDDDD